MRVLLVAVVLLLSSCASGNSAVSSDSTSAVTTPPANSAVEVPDPTPKPVADPEPPAVEIPKDCPLGSLTALEAMVVVQSAQREFTQVVPSIGQSVVSSVRVVEVLWKRPEIELATGDIFDGLVYAHSSTPQQWGFDDEWLAGEERLVTGLSSNQIREVDVAWELASVLVARDGTLRFPVECFDSRFDELSTRTQRRADLDLYLDLLVDDQEFRDCRQQPAAESCVPGLVLAAALGIDDELPGE